MCGKNGKRSGWICLSPGTLRRVGITLAIVGGLMIVVFVPIRYWMALIGLILLIIGTALLLVY